MTLPNQSLPASVRHRVGSTAREAPPRSPRRHTICTGRSPRAHHAPASARALCTDPHRGRPCSVRGGARRERFDRAATQSARRRRVQRRAGRLLPLTPPGASRRRARGCARETDLARAGPPRWVGRCVAAGAAFKFGSAGQGAFQTFEVWEAPSPVEIGLG